MAMQQDNIEELRKKLQQCMDEIKAEKTKNADIDEEFRLKLEWLSEEAEDVYYKIRTIGFYIKEIKHLVSSNMFSVAFLEREDEKRKPVAEELKKLAEECNDEQLAHRLQCRVEGLRMELEGILSQYLHFFSFDYITKLKEIVKVLEENELANRSRIVNLQIPSF